MVRRLMAPALDASDALDTWWTGIFEHDKAEDVDLRLGELLNEIKFSDHASIVLVSHSNLIRALLSRRLHSSVRSAKPELARQAGECKLANCTVLRLELDFRKDLSECIVDIAAVFDGQFEASKPKVGVLQQKRSRTPPRRPKTNVRQASSPLVGRGAAADVAQRQKRSSSEAPKVSGTLVATGFAGNGARAPLSVVGEEDELNPLKTETMEV